MKMSYTNLPYRKVESSNVQPGTVSSSDLLLKH